ncbi:MAG TPA: glycosyltransferase [Thermomicrobiales bacterium]|nr:glycosyltransferase [Thermomicrobiales bacterium]
MEPRASVVIPTHNRWAQLSRVLAAYAELAPGEPPFEVIVCDDASDDETPGAVAAFAAPYPLAYQRQEKKGPAAARNLGIRAARAETVILTDDDCIPQPGLVARHVARTRPGVATIGRIAWHPDLPVTPFMDFLCPGYMFDYDLIADPEDATFRCFYTANVSAARADLLAVGGFDERFPAAAYEDIELGYRLTQAGVRLVYEPAALIHHLHEMRLDRALGRQIVNGRSAAYAITKHPDLALDAGVPGLRDPTLPRRFFHAALDYYFMVGLQQGLQGAFGGEWADRLDDLLERYPKYAQGVERQFFESLAYARRLERRIGELEHEHERLATWARALEREAQRRPEPAPRRLARAAVGRLRRLAARRPGATPAR